MRHVTVTLLSLVVAGYIPLQAQKVDPVTGYKYGWSISWVNAECSKDTSVHTPKIYFFSEAFKWSGSHTDSRNLEKEFERYVKERFALNYCDYVNHIPLGIKPPRVSSVSEAEQERHLRTSYEKEVEEIRSMVRRSTSLPKPVFRLLSGWSPDDPSSGVVE